MWPHGSLLGFLRLLRLRTHGRGIMIVDKDQKEVDYDPRFRLYLQTRLSNPQYQPEVTAQTTLVNFMVTEAGLIIALSRCDRGKEASDSGRFSIRHARCQKLHEWTADLQLPKVPPPHEFQIARFSSLSASGCRSFHPAPAARDHSGSDWRR